MNITKIVLSSAIILSFAATIVLANPQILTYHNGYWLNDRDEDRTAHMTGDDVVFNTIQADPWVIEVISPQLTYYGSTTTTLTIKPATFQFIAEPLAGYAKQGNFGWFSLATQRNNGIFGSISPISNGDEYRWPIEMAAGNYTFVGFFITANNLGIQEVWINSSTYSKLVFTRDGYSSTTVPNAQHMVDFQLLEDVTGNLTYKANGKNSASSNYGLYYSSMVITSKP